MSLITAPRVEGTVRVRDGRRLSFAEWGAPNGRAIAWLHGTPGGRRQVPEEARRAALELDVRLIGIDRPGVGRSTPHLYESVSDFVPDLEMVLDDLGIDEVGLVGLSGGGPYVLAAAAAWPNRVTAACVLGGVAPTQGEDAVPGGLVGLAVRFSSFLGPMRIPLTVVATGLIQLLQPVAESALDLYAMVSPPGDREVLSRPEIKAMFLDDLIGNSRRGISAPFSDVILFTRHWGFTLDSVKQPVLWIHGDSDNIVPEAHAHHTVARLPEVSLRIHAGESHLGGLGAAEEVMEWILATWDAPARISR